LYNSLIAVDTKSLDVYVFLRREVSYMRRGIDSN